MAIRTHRPATAGPHVFDLAPYRQQAQDDLQKRRVCTINELKTDLLVLAALGFHPVGIFAEPQGGANLPALSEQQLLDSKADPENDYFPLVYHLAEDDHPVDEAVGDVVFRSGTSFNGGELYTFIHGTGDGASSSDPIGTIKNLILWHWPNARGGEGTGALKLDAVEPQARVVDISAAAEAAFVGFLSRDTAIAARAYQVLGVDPGPVKSAFPDPNPRAGIHKDIPE